MFKTHLTQKQRKKLVIFSNHGGCMLQKSAQLNSKSHGRIIVLYNPLLPHNLLLPQDIYMKICMLRSEQGQLNY